MKRKQSGWGGARPGAGRPSGTGNPESARRNRVVVMVTDRELAHLKRMADREEIPLATWAYEVLARGMKQMRGSERRPSREKS